MNKKLIIEIVVIVVVLVIAGYLWLARSNVPTSDISLSEDPFGSSAESIIQPEEELPVDEVEEEIVENNIPGWEIYTNNKYGFEIQYPGDYLISDENRIGMESRFDGLKISEPSGNFDMKVRVIKGIDNYKWGVVSGTYEFDIDKKTFVSEFGNDVTQLPNQNNSEMYLLESSDIGVFVKDYYIPNYEKDFWVVLEYDGDENNIYFQGLQSQFNNFENNFKTVISTFKFTK